MDYKELVKKDLEESFDWKDKLSKGKGGIPLSTIENYILYLENDEKYKGKLKYNEFAQKKEFNGEYFDDFKMESIYLNIEKDLGSLNRSNADTALINVFMSHRYDPVKDYIKGLKWDNKERIDTLFIDLLDADDTELVRYMTRKWMIAGIKRVLQPGCKFDNILVLTGAQGTGKSTICERLGKGYTRYFSFEDISGLNQTDTLVRVAGSWISIFDELDGLKKKEKTVVKDFLSKTEDIVRKKYGHEDSIFKRRCVFIGSTNDDTPLSDTTGNRRFWMIKCNKTTRDSKVFDTMTPEYVDQLWAEAYHYYKENPKQYLDIPENMVDEFNKKQKSFNSFYNDAAVSFLDTYLDKKFNINEDGEIYDFDDLRCQDEDGCMINKIPVYVVSQLLTNERFPFKSVKGLIQGLPDWEYKVAKYKKLGRKNVTSLVRKEPVVQEKKKYDPMDAFKHISYK